MKSLKDIMKDPYGKIIISMLIGFGFACMFYTFCKNDDCYIIKAPALTDLEKYYYKIDKDCYKYSPYETDCKKNSFGVKI